MGVSIKVWKSHTANGRGAFHAAGAMPGNERQMGFGSDNFSRTPESGSDNFFELGALVGLGCDFGGQ